MRWSHGLLLTSLLLFSIGSGPAQSNNPAAIHTVGQALDFWISNTETRVVSAADAMPEEKYSYAPTAGEFAGVRTFAQQIKHLAANNYRMAAYILNQTPTQIKSLRPGRTPFNRRPKSWTTSKGRSQCCIGLWLRSMKETC